MASIQDRLDAIWWLCGACDGVPEWHHYYGEHALSVELSPSRVSQFRRRWPDIVVKYQQGDFCGVATVWFTRAEMIECDELRPVFHKLNSPHYPPPTDRQCWQGHQLQTANWNWNSVSKQWETTCYCGEHSSYREAGNV